MRKAGGRVRNYTCNQYSLNIILKSLKKLSKIYKANETEDIVHILLGLFEFDQVNSNTQQGRNHIIFSGEAEPMGFEWVEIICPPPPLTIDYAPAQCQFGYLIFFFGG